MITSYEVGSIFKIVDEASPTLERIARIGKQVAESIGAAEKSLRSFSRVTFGNLTRGANATADAAPLADAGKFVEHALGNALDAKLRVVGIRHTMTFIANSLQ